MYDDIAFGKLKKANDKKQISILFPNKYPMLDNVTYGMSGVNLNPNQFPSVITAFTARNISNTGKGMPESLDNTKTGKSPVVTPEMAYLCNPIKGKLNMPSPAERVKKGLILPNTLGNSKSLEDVSLRPMPTTYELCDYLENKEYKNSDDMANTLDYLNAEIARLQEEDDKIASTCLTAYNTEKNEDRIDFLEDKIARMKEVRDKLSGEYFYTKAPEDLSKIMGDFDLRKEYYNIKVLEIDLYKIEQVENDAVDQNGGPEIAQYKTYLKNKYGLTDKAIINYSIGIFNDTEDRYDITWQLKDDIKSQIATSKSVLNNNGCDFDRIKAYEQIIKVSNIAEIEKEMDIQYANDVPVLASIDTVVSGIGKPFEVAKNYINNIGHNDSRDYQNYVPMTSANMRVTNMIDTVRSTVSSNIEENTNWNLFGHNVLSSFYNIGMNVADDAFSEALFGPASIYFMGMSSCADMQKEILDKGGTNRQALYGGLAAGATDILIDKYGVDNLLRQKNSNSVKESIGYFLKKEGLGGANSSLQEIASIIAETSSMSDSSDYYLAVQDYRSKGYSTDEAKKKAYLDILGRVSQAYVEGTITTLIG